MKKTAGVLLLVGLGWAVQAHAKSASEVFEAVSPSVVVIKGFDAKGKQVSLGSGVALSADEVATNCHVLEGGKSYQVVYRGKEYQANLRHSDWQRDVCSLAAPGLNARPATLGATGKLKVGQKVFAVGAPQGLALSLSDGLVSNLRPVTGGQYLQITAPISPGSSGGGLFDEDGLLIGLPTFYLTDGQQLNFAVPVEWLKELPKRQQVAKSGQADTNWHNKAIALEEKKDWEGLRKHALAWTKARPTDAAAWYSLGVAYGKANQSANAIEAYQQAIRINPEDAKAWNNLGIAYITSNQTLKAIEALQQVIRINPEDTNAWVVLGIAYADSNQLAKAIEAYQQAIRINPEDAEAWNNLGAAYGNSNQPAKEIEAYQQAIRINPEVAKTWYNLGNVYGNSNQPAKEIEAYQQAIRINPEYAGAWYNLGIAYRKANQLAKAIEAYQQAIRINPEHAEAWNNLGVAYKIAGQNGKVMEVYKKLKTLDPGLADSFFNKIVLP